MINLRGILAASKTYKVRLWAFDAGIGEYAGLTIIQARSDKPDAVRQVKHYDVEEDGSQVAPCRTFLLRRADGEIHETTLGPTDRCTCDAGRAKLRCCHVDAVRAVMNAGGFDGGHDAAAIEAAFGGTDWHPEAEAKMVG